MSMFPPPPLPTPSSSNQDDGASFLTFLGGLDLCSAPHYRLPGLCVRFTLTLRWIESDWLLTSLNLTPHYIWLTACRRNSAPLQRSGGRGGGERGVQVELHRISLMPAPRRYYQTNGVYSVLLACVEGDGSRASKCSHGCRLLLYPCGLNSFTLSALQMPLFWATYIASIFT